MAKSRAKAKTNKRLRRSRRELMDREITQKKLEMLHNKILLSNKGFEYREPVKPNAFLYPDTVGSEFPQFVPDKPLDFRSSNNPFSGGELKGGKRKVGAKHTVRVRVAGQIEDVLPDPNAGSTTLLAKTLENENELIGTMLNMKILDTQVKKGLGKGFFKSKRRRLKNTKRATRF